MYEFYTVVDLTHDDPTLYPAPSLPHSPYPFRWEAADGRARQTLQAQEAKILLHTPDGWTRTEALTGRLCEVVFTESRMVIYRRENSLGGHGIGRITCTHIRYSWIAQVSTARDKRGNEVALRVVVDAGSADQPQFVAFVLPVVRSSSAPAFAAYLTKMVAVSRIINGVCDDEVAEWDALAGTTGSPTAAAAWNMPSYIQVRRGGLEPAGAAGLAAAPAAEPTTSMAAAVSTRPAPYYSDVVEDLRNLDRPKTVNSSRSLISHDCGCHSSCAGCSRSVRHGTPSCPHCGHPLPAALALSWDRIC